MRSIRGEQDADVREEAQVDYAMSAHAVLAPASVTHREYRNGALAAENLFTYAPFRRFGASADVKFTEMPQKP
jgi:hypothetical protein